MGWSDIRRREEKRRNSERGVQRWSGANEIVRGDA
jgi:hypothetical protein